MFKTALLLLFEGIIIIYLTMAVANGHKIITGLVIAYFFIWQAVHRGKIKRQDDIIDRLLKMEMEHNQKMLEIGERALHGKK